MMQKLKFFHRAPNAIRLDGERDLIGRQTESDRAADGIRSGGRRNLIGQRTESDRAADASGGKMLRVMVQRARSDGLSVGGYGISFPLCAALARR